MEPLIYCLLSSGHLDLLPYDPFKKENGAVSSPFSETDDQISKSASLTSLSSQSISYSPAPEVIDLANKTILESVTTTPSAHSLYLPSHYIKLSSSSIAQVESDSNLRIQLFKMLTLVFPTWTNIKNLKIKQLTGGITNMLLSVTNTETSEIVLIRTYGQGTSLIIDRDREFVSQLFLNSLDLASSIHARFANGLVYGFLPGRSLSPDELSHPKLYPLIAQRLGHWHNVIDTDEIEQGILKMRGLKVGNDSNSKLIKDLWGLMQDWIRVLPEIDSLLETCLKYADLLQEDVKSAPQDFLLLQNILTSELQWLIEEISHRSPVVACHSDLLSGNVIIPDSLSEEILHGPEKSYQKPGDITENPISFIDYEYMLPLPRAFDISNHFMEWQGFECDKSKIPVPSKDNLVMRNWASLYLSSVQSVDLDDNAVDQLIEEISLFYGLPGFYWGIWAGIQSTISLIEFDYKTYSSQRLEEYFVWKKGHLE